MVDGERMVGSHLTGTTAAMPFGPALEADGLSEADRDGRAASTSSASRGWATCTSRPPGPRPSPTHSPTRRSAQLAWVVEKFQAWTDPAAALPEDAVDRDQLLTNVSLTWFNRAGASSAHATYEGMQAYREIAASRGDGGWDEGPARPACGVRGVRGRQHHPQPRRPAGTVEHWSEFDTGGHFPAMEVPDLLVEDVRTFFRPLR